MKKLLLVLILSYVAFPQAGKSVLTSKQRDSIQVMIDNTIDTTVTGTTPIRTKIVYVEDYGTDEAAIKEAIDSAGTGGVVEFEPNRIYTQTDGIRLNLYDGLTIKGNGATLKRGAQQVTTLTDTVSQYTTVLHVASIPTGWEIGDELQIYTDSTVTTSSRVMEILSINGLDITLESRVNTNANLIAMVWNIGDKVRKTYGQIVGAVEYDHHIYDLTFDGNKAENNGNYYFALNEALWIFKRSTVSNCRFYNMPNENIFGNGMTITGCYAQDLNGSFFHATGQNYYDIDNFYGTVSNCLTYNTNIMPSVGVNGHSEGVITWSATAGRVNIHDNFFFNGGEAVLGYVTWGGDTDGGTRDFVFTDNFCRNFDNITSLMYRNYSDHKPGHFVITNNVFDSCGTNDWTDYTTSLVDYDSVHIAGNQLWGGTTWTNLPTWSNIQQSFQTSDIITEDITAEGITSTGITIANGDLYVWDASVLGTEIYDFANAVSDTSGSEANDDLEWYGSIGTPTLSVESTDIQTGTYSLKLTAIANGDVEGMVDTLTGFGVGQTYKISLWAKAGTTADTISQKITGWEGFDVSPNESVTSSWAQYVYYLTATNDTVMLAIYVSSFGAAYGGSVGDEILIDNLSIQKVQGGDIIARGNLGYGNYYFENPTPTNGYVLKTDGNGVATWQPDISTSGTGLFNPDGVTVDTTAGGLARITLAYQDSIHAKMNRTEMTSYSKTTHTHTIANVTGLQDSLNKFAEIGDLGGSGTDSATVISLVHDVLDSLNETNGYYVSRVESFSGSSAPMVINPQDSGDVLIITATGLIPTGWQNGDDIRLFYGTTDDIVTSLATPSTGSQDIFISLFGYVTVDDTADVNFGLYQAGNGDLVQSSTVITLKRNTIRTYVDTLSLSWGILDTVLTGSLSGWKVPNDITITEISAYTDANTCTFNIEERAEITPNSAGTDVIGSDLVADTNQEETSTFTNATIAKNTWLVPTISATGDVSIFTISVRYIKTD